ncbi:unnamed protein product, partial [marine sediment metagenome]
VFEPPSVISRVRRVLIKPSAAYPVSYPVTTSQSMLSAIVEGIRQVSDADILILEGTPGGEPVFPIYQALDYNFPRVSISYDSKPRVANKLGRRLIPSRNYNNIVAKGTELGHHPLEQIAVVNSL